MTPEKIELLRGLLSRLPESMAARLAGAIEADRLVGGDQLPHDLIMDGLRPTLRRANRGTRKATAVRLFCLPFEDLLSSAPRKQKQKGRIARSSVARVWKWLANDLLADDTAAFVRDIRAAVLAERPDEADARALAYWASAHAALHAALAQKSKAAVLKVLGDDAAIDDANEIALLLSVAPEIVAFQDKVPRPIEAMTDDRLWTFRDLYDRLVATAPDAAPFVALIAMNRLAHPWEALRLPLMVSRQTQDTLISNTDMGLVGELLFSDIEMHADAIRAAKHPVFDADDLVRHGHAFAGLSNGLVKEVGVRRDGKWGQRLLSDRAAIAEVMEGMMERAPREILGVFALHRGGFGNKGPRVPDLSRPLDNDKHQRAVRYAQLLMGCKSFATAGSFGAAQLNAFEQVTNELTRFNEELVRELRAAEGDKKHRAEQYFAVAVELAGIVFGSEEVALLHRRARAALAA